jgi:DNA mismatch endonuclease (patch repair protein)
MVDVFSKEKRSFVMRQVKSSRNKSTELKLIAFFKENQLSGWRRNYKIFGKPDFVFINSKKALFVDGCFWHGHNCRNTKPKDNHDYWVNKIKRNKQRDEKVNQHLTLIGWKVVRLWECELKNPKKIMEKINGILY